MSEALLQVVQAIGANGAPLTAQDHEANRPVEGRNFACGEGSRDFFGQAQSGDSKALAIVFFDVVIDLDFPITDEHVVGQSLELLAHRTRHELVRIYSKSGRTKVLH